MKRLDLNAIAGAILNETILHGPTVRWTEGSGGLGKELPRSESKVGQFPSNWRDVDVSKANK